MVASGILPMDRIITHKYPLKDFKKGIEQVGAVVFLKSLLDYVRLTIKPPEQHLITYSSENTLSKILLKIL
jgi:hypothetical protein